MKIAKSALICFMMAWIFLVGTNIPVEASEPILSRIDVGYWDIWRHADGKTWTDSDGDGKKDEPGQTKEVTFNKLQSPAELVEYENLNFKIKPILSISEQEYVQHGGWSGLLYDDFIKDILQYLPQNYQQKDSKTVAFKLQGTYDNIKKDWQGQLVEGRRYYLPVLVEWYGEKAEGNKLWIVEDGVKRTWSDGTPFEKYSQADRTTILQNLPEIHEYSSKYIPWNSDWDYTFGIRVGYLGEKEEIEFIVTVHHQGDFDYPLLTKTYLIKNGETVDVYLPLMENKYARNTAVALYYVTTQEFEHTPILTGSTSYS